jgi:adenylate kinase family enzyme
MKNIFYFIGASGVGKSTICRMLIKENLKMQYEKLDLIYRRFRDKEEIGREEAIKETKEKIIEIENSSDDIIYLVDAGNFAQKVVGINFWKNLKGNIILLVNDKISLDNYVKRIGGRTKEKWEKAENFSDRDELYNLAKYTVNSEGLDEEKTKQEILKILKDYL